VLGDRLAVGTWIAWALGVAASVVLVAALTITLGPGEADRHALWSRLRAIRTGVLKR
jgi:hypothetical protein